MRFSLSAIELVCCCRLLIPDRAWAHGESVRGIGSTSINTTGGTIADGVSLSLRYDRRAYRLFREEESPAQCRRRVRDLTAGSPRGVTRTDLWPPGPRAGARSRD